MSDEIIKRTVKVTEPFCGEIEVEINLTKIALSMAERGLRNLNGESESSLACKVALPSGLKAARNAYLALNHGKSEGNRMTATYALEVLTADS